MPNSRCSRKASQGYGAAEMRGWAIADMLDRGGEALRPGMRFFHFVSEQGRIVERFPGDRILAEEGIVRGELVERCPNGCEHLGHIFVGQELKVDADGRLERHAERDVAIETVGFDCKNLNGCGIGDCKIRSGRFQLSALLCPGFDPLQKAREWKRRADDCLFGKIGGRDRPPVFRDRRQSRLA